MPQPKLGVVVKSVKLMEYTIQVTSNRKRYPVKYIQLIKRIQDLGIDIYEQLMDANTMDITNEKQERITMQTKAITSCNKLSQMVEISMNLKLIGADTAFHWQKLISEVQHMVLAWRSKDRSR